MKFYLLLVLLLFIPKISFASDTLTFTDQDLNQYKRASDAKKIPSGENIPAKTNVPPVDGAHLQTQKGFEVPYKAYEGNSRRIIIPVKFNNAVTVPMLLDTGAPGMLISPRLAAKLGLFDKDNARIITTAGGVGGSTLAFFTIIDTVQIGPGRDYFMPTKVSKMMSDQYEGLVGMDFMAKYTVKVDTKRHVVVFEELPPRGDVPGGHDEEWWRVNFQEFASMRSWCVQAKKDLIEKEKNNDQNLNENLSGNEISERKRFLDWECLEANKLFDKLNGYAARNSVPMQWRQY